MTLLVLDTATDRCALALSVDGKVFENTRSIPRAHNEHLLQMLDDLFAEASVSPRDLSAIGFAAGPGSFTGIRISAAACQALAIAADACVIPVSSSQLLAGAARRQFADQQAPAGFQTILRSRRNYVYLADFAVVPASEASGAGQVLALRADDVLLEDAQVAQQSLPEGWVRVVEGQDDADALNAYAVEVTVADLLALTEAELAAGGGLPPEGAQPRYVSGDTPWKPRAPVDPAR